MAIKYHYKRKPQKHYKIGGITLYIFNKKQLQTYN